MLGECKIAFSKKSNNQWYLQEGAAFASTRQVTINDSQCMSSLSPHQYVWYSENYYCRACWQDVWLTSIRGHVCGLKVNDNQFVTYISCSSESLSSTASFPSFFMVHSSHSIFSSNLHLLPLRSKTTVVPVTSVKNTVRGGRRRVKASEMFFNIWLRGLRLPHNASLCSVF